MSNPTTTKHRIRILAAGITVALAGTVFVAPAADAASTHHRTKQVTGSGLLRRAGHDFTKAEMLSATPVDLTAAPGTSDAPQVLSRAINPKRKAIMVKGADTAGPLARARIQARTRFGAPKGNLQSDWICDTQNPIGVGLGGPGYCDDATAPVDEPSIDPSSYEPSSYNPVQSPIQVPTDITPEPTPAPAPEPTPEPTPAPAPEPQPAPAPAQPDARTWDYSRVTWGTDQSNLVTRTTGRIFWDEGTSLHFCTGTVVNTANQSVVWTAGHCVHSGAGGTFHNTNWRFVPGYDNGNAPYGQFPARELWSTNQWMQNGGEHGPFLEDFGAGIVGRDGQGRTLMQAVNGGQGILFNQAVDQTFVQVGYPGEGQFDGSVAYACLNHTAEVQAETDGTTPTQIGVGCDMTGGSSGGPWLIGLQSNGVGYVNSVTSNGSALTPQMHGAYQGANAYTLFQSVASR